MSEHAEQPTGHALEHPGYGTYIKVWIVLLLLTAGLVALSHVSQSKAILGLLTLTPLKAALVFYYFMHLRYEPPLLKGVVLAALGTLLIYFALLFSDVAFR